VAELNDLVARIPGFYSWGHPEKIRFFGWYLHTFEKKERFVAADIRRCYETLPDDQPSNVNPYLAALVGKKPKQALKDTRGYQLVHGVRKEYDKLYGQREIAVQTTKLLEELPAKVPNVAERDFLGEALICYRNGAFRAAIVMTWNLAYSHLLEFILAHHLAGFNTKYQTNYPGKWPKAKAVPIATFDDFSVDLKESEVLAIAKSANAISNDVFKVLESKLGRRNSAAHPSSVAIGQLQAEELINDLVTNVVSKLMI
jgi:hypothetical protein